MIIRTLASILVTTIPFLPTDFGWPQELTFKDHGRLVKKISLQQLESLTRAKTVTVFEPHESEIRDYIGFSVNQLLYAVYGKGWETAEEVLFTCSDGYQPSIPSSQFRKYASYLVYASLGKKEFNLINKLQNN